MNLAKPENPEFAKDHLRREPAGASRGHLMALPQKVTHTFSQVFIDRSAGHQPSAQMPGVRLDVSMHCPRSAPLAGFERSPIGWFWGDHRGVKMVLSPAVLACINFRVLPAVLRS